MIVTPLQEEFLRDFFAKQREISKESLENVTLLAEANIKTILMTGLISPPTIERMEQLLKDLKRDREAAIKEITEVIQKDDKGKT